MRLISHEVAEPHNQQVQRAALFGYRNCSTTKHQKHVQCARDAGIGTERLVDPKSQYES
jgi:hypothetical protein